MAVSCYIVFSILTNHISFFTNAPHIIKQNFRKLKTLLEYPQEWNLPKNLFFFTILANLQGFCYLFWYIFISPCFWKWLMSFPDQQKSQPVPSNCSIKCTMKCTGMWSKNLTSKLWQFHMTVLSFFHIPWKPMVPILLIQSVHLHLHQAHPSPKHMLDAAWNNSPNKYPGRQWVGKYQCSP